MLAALTNTDFAYSVLPAVRAHVKSVTRGWAQVPEHTWGLDTREALPDFTHWGNAAFHAQLEDQAAMYLRTVASWKEQKSFVDHAISALEPEQVPHPRPPHCPECCLHPYFGETAVHQGNFRTSGAHADGEFVGWERGGEEKGRGFKLTRTSHSPAHR